MKERSKQSQTNKQGKATQHTQSSHFTCTCAITLTSKLLFCADSSTCTMYIHVHVCVQRYIHTCTCMYSSSTVPTARHFIVLLAIERDVNGMSCSQLCPVSRSFGSCSLHMYKYRTVKIKLAIHSGQTVLLKTKHCSQTGLEPIDTR